MSDATVENANKKVHSVESQWHYDRMINSGFKAITKSQIGFVRRYDYENGVGHKISAYTGVSADYWMDTTTGNGGYHASLTPHLSSINSEV